FLFCTAAIKQTSTMSSGGASDVDLDADFVYDYETLRIIGLSIAGVIVFLSILLLVGNRIRRCGKSK
ncbi:sodium/potassium-transporting ATPase subunit gamma-like, partial [Clarias magur]